MLRLGCVHYVAVALTPLAYRKELRVAPIMRLGARQLSVTLVLFHLSAAHSTAIMCCMVPVHASVLQCPLTPLHIHPHPPTRHPHHPLLLFRPGGLKTPSGRIMRRSQQPQHPPTLPRR
jgi:hypothetical protein